MALADAKTLKSMATVTTRTAATKIAVSPTVSPPKARTEKRIARRAHDVGEEEGVEAALGGHAHADAMALTPRGVRDPARAHRHHRRLRRLVTPSELRSGW
jgi:hypothetical protein